MSVTWLTISHRNSLGTSTWLTSWVAIAKSRFHSNPRGNGLSDIAVNNAE